MRHLTSPELPRALHRHMGTSIFHRFPPIEACLAA